MWSCNNVSRFCSYKWKAKRSGLSETNPRPTPRQRSADANKSQIHLFFAFSSSIFQILKSKFRPSAMEKSKLIANQSTAVWSGSLPPRNANKSAFSCKVSDYWAYLMAQEDLGSFSCFESPFIAQVFLGGVPWDITEKDLLNAFGCFGSLRVEWPGIHDKNRTRLPKGQWRFSVCFRDSVCSFAIDFEHRKAWI